MVKYKIEILFFFCTQYIAKEKNGKHIDVYDLGNGEFISALVPNDVSRSLEHKHLAKGQFPQIIWE